MSKTATVYAGTLAMLVAVALAVHFATALDWPWAIVVGAGVSVVARASIAAARGDSNRS